MTISYCGQTQVIEEVGYHSFWSILSPGYLIAFSVPDRAMNELLESSEWVAFQNLLEKYQEEDVQRQLQAEKERQERLGYKETSYLQPQAHACDNTPQHIWDKVRKIIPFLRR